MAQADGVVANGTGSAVRSDINTQYAALWSNHSGSTEPSSGKVAYQLWADTNSGYLKIRNAANNAWIQLFKLDGTDLANICRLTGSTNNTITTVTGANAIQGEANLTFDGSTLKLKADNGELVVKNASNTDAFSVDSDNGNTYMAGNVGIGTTPVDPLTMASAKIASDGQLRVKRHLTSAVDIKAVKGSNWGYSTGSYSGVLIGNPTVGTLSTIFMGVDTTGNSGGNFTGQGQEIVFRNNHEFCIPNAANNNFLYPISLNKGAATEGVPRFKQGLLFGTDTADANILQDYEEGTFDVTFASGAAYANYNKLSYTKIGNIVNVCGQFRVETAASTGTLTINNLPFSVLSHSEGESYSPPTVYCSEIDFGANTKWVSGYVHPGATSMSLLGITDNSTTETLPGTADGYIMINLTYKAA